MRLLATLAPPVVNVEAESLSVVGLQSGGAWEGDWETVEVSGARCVRARRCEATPTSGFCRASYAVRADVIDSRIGGP